MQAHKTVGWPAVVLGLLLSATASAANFVVTANPNLTFSPSSITINAGDTVTFRNGGGFHNVVSDPGSVTSFRCASGCDGAGGNGNLSSAAWSATVTFPTAGTIGYFCQAHGSPGGVGMAGRITVNAVPPLTPSLRATSTGMAGRTSCGATAARARTRSGVRPTPPLRRPFTAVTNLAWRVVGIGDFDANGQADVLWRNLSNGSNAIWRSANRATPQAVTAVTNLAWNVAGVGDFDNNGRADILWRNDSTGTNVIWRAGSAARPRRSPPVTNLAWRIVGVGDFNGDGQGRHPLAQYQHRREHHLAFGKFRHAQ